MKDTSALTLRQWTWRAFAKSSLIPLFMVETLLIGVYLFTNLSIRDTQIEHLRDVAITELQSVADSQSRVINGQLAQVGELTEIYRRLTTHALTGPVPAARPVLALSDGVRYTPHDDGGAAVFYSNATPAHQQDLDKVARLSTIDPLLKSIKHQNALVAQVYFNSWDSLNHIYPWFETLSQYPHDMNIPAYNFYYLADASHNPSRQVVWTDVYLDPAGQGWMMSSIAPVYRDTFLEGVVGLDITVSDMLSHIAKLEIPWGGYAMLVSREGNIMALPKAGEDDFGLRELTEHSYDDAIRKELFKPEDFNLRKRQETFELGKAMAAHESGVKHITFKNEPHIVAWSTIAQTGWQLLTVVAEPDVYADTNALAHRYEHVGYWMIGGLIGFYAVFFTYLWLRAAQFSGTLRSAIQGISRMMADIGRGEFHPDRPHMAIAELDDAAEHAQTMGNQLEASKNEKEAAQNALLDTMRNYNQRLENEVRQRTEELVEMQKKLVTTEKMAALGVFTAGMAHEINNPANFLSMGSQNAHAQVNDLESYLNGLLDRDEASAEILSGFSARFGRIRESLAIVRNGIDRINDVVSRLRASNPEGAPEKHPIDIIDLLESVWKFVSPTLNDDISIRSSFHVRPLFNCNVGEFNQVFIALLTNAGHAIEEAMKTRGNQYVGVITLRSRMDDTVLVIDIADNGTGIADDVGDKIFDPFFTTRTVGQGAGLGLSVTRDVVQGHGGTIEYTTTEGEGTCFTLRLPLL